MTFTPITFLIETHCFVLPWSHTTIPCFTFYTFNSSQTRQSLTLIEVDVVLPFLAVSGATILGPLHYVCASANVVADGETFKAALAVPDGLSRLTDLSKQAGALDQNNLSVNSKLERLCSNCDTDNATSLLHCHHIYCWFQQTAQILTPPGPVLVSLVCW